MSGRAITRRQSANAIRTRYARSEPECSDGVDLAPAYNQLLFLTRDGRPYLEPHHIRRLTDGASVTVVGVEEEEEELFTSSHKMPD